MSGAKNGATRNGAKGNGTKGAMRVGVLFGGKSGEHEVSLASARTVMDALAQAGYQTVPIGISPEGRWLTSGDPHARLTQGEPVIGGNALAGDEKGRDPVPQALTPFVPMEEQ
ncbi:MAG: hypothetical protein WBO46_21115, partial [Caldilineaceae bacterium]